MEVLLDSDRAGFSRTTINAVEAKTGMTALHFAAANGHTEMVKFLLKRGAGTD
jgi:ankyrin repeat protein